MSKVIALRPGVVSRPSSQLPVPKKVADQRRIIRKLSEKLRELRKDSSEAPP
jgi:hypothetical protein